jgi:sec-independent protein translocase protein TatA
MGSFGVAEIAFVLAVLMLLFGAKRIPLIARGLGEGIRNFKNSFKGSKGDGDGDTSLPPGEDPRDS